MFESLKNFLRLPRTVLKFGESFETSKNFLRNQRTV